MGSEEGRIIRPPMKDVTSGRVFKPDTRFYYKEWFIAIFVAVFFWMLAVGTLILGSWIYMMDNNEPWTTFLAVFFDVLPILNFWYAIALVFWWCPIMVGIPLYIRSIEYSVISKSGLVMPEIYVKKGLINITRKHVPFRTITNISSRAGPMDRLFGIGTVEIQTAGFSGGPGGQAGPEEKLEGITFYEEVRDFILQELRRFRDPYVTGTEVVLPRDDPVPRLSESLDDEMLITLHEIRNVLERIEQKNRQGGELEMTSEGKVIKPPVENVASGKVFKPSKAFRNKMWFTGVFTAVMLWVIIFGSFVFTIWLVDWITGSSTGLSSFFQYWWLTLNLWYWVITAIWLVPAVIIVPFYLRSIEYSAIAQSGETMPEIFVKKGIINITRKHVPFRTITNISSRAGLFDRLFGIGSIEIETAGYSGTTSSAEEKLEGITFYEELRDFILRELRKFKDPYATGTEVVLPEEELVPRVDDSLEDEILLVLREIRDLLRKERE